MDEAATEMPMIEALVPVPVLAEELVKLLTVLAIIVAAAFWVIMPITCAAVPAVLVTFTEFAGVPPIMLPLAVKVADVEVLILMPVKEALPVAEVLLTLNPPMPLPLAVVLEVLKFMIPIASLAVVEVEL